MTYPARNFYKNHEVVRSYENTRFGGLMGRYRYHREQRAVNSIFSMIPDNQSVLDCPVGIGRWAEQLAGRGHEVVGADISDAMLHEAGRRLRRSGFGSVQLHRTEAENLPFDDGEFDYVFCHALTKHLPADSQVAVLSELSRVSARGVICSFGVSEGLPGLLWRMRGITEGACRSVPELKSLAHSCGLKLVCRRKCTTPIGVENTILFAKL